MKDILVRNRFRVDRKIGEGGHGMVYMGADMNNGCEVAIKFSDCQKVPYLLENEGGIYKVLGHDVGIPKMIWIGKEDKFDILVLELLGPSLEDVFNYCNRRFSLKTILLVASQAVSRLQRVHQRVIHRDIKPNNFALGTGKQGNILYMIDFGLAKELPDWEDRNALCRPVFYGTPCYASINHHKGYEQSWGDDLESLGYMFIYFARGRLPWHDVKRRRPDVEEKEATKQEKMECTGYDLSEGCGLPAEFGEFIEYARSLGCRDKPDYRYLQRLFHQRLKAEGFKNDNVFDWTIKRFNELQSEEDRNGDKSSRASEIG